MNCIQAIGWGCSLTWKLSSGRSTFQLTHMEVGRSLVLAVDINSLPNQSLQRAAHNIIVCFPKNEEFRETEKDIPRGRSHSLLYNLIWKLTFHNICHILFTRNELINPDPTHNQEEEITQGHKYQEREIIEGYLRICLPYSHTITQNELLGLLFKSYLW